MSNVKTATLLDIRRAKKDNSYPVKLRVTFERKQKYYPTPHDLTEKEFERIMFGQRLVDADKILKKKVLAFENKATDVIKDLPLFSWKIFEKHYLADRGMKDTINQAFTDYATQLRNEARIGSAVAYECAKSSLNKFSKDAKFTDVNPDFLKKYEKWMLADDKSITTVGMYLRALRTLFNNAIAEGTLPRDFYPFGKRKYEIPTGNNIKKAIPLSDIGLVFNYEAEAGSMTERAKDYWIFMYLCNGINVKDLCLLKYENIKDDMLEFVRAKTARTKRKVEPIRVVVTDEVKAIINKWGNRERNSGNYIFPVLQKGLTPERERQLIQQLTQVINSHTKNIAKDLKINGKLTTYVARHAFSTVLKRSGVSTEFISEALGHSDVKTTQSYLAGFEDGSKREAAKALTAFKK